MFVFFENMLASIKTAAMLLIKIPIGSYGTGEAYLLPVDKQQLYKSQVPRSRVIRRRPPLVQGTPIYTPIPPLVRSSAMLKE